jgi:hypothetical protein
VVKCFTIDSIIALVDAAMSSCEVINFLNWSRWSGGRFAAILSAMSSNNAFGGVA